MFTAWRQPEQHQPQRGNVVGTRTAEHAITANKPQGDNTFLS